MNLCKMKPVYQTSYTGVLSRMRNFWPDAMGYRDTLSTESLFQNIQGESKKTLHFSIVCCLKMLQFARNCFICALSRTLAASFGTSYTLQNFIVECKWSHLANWVKSHLRQLIRGKKEEKKKYQKWYSFIAEAQARQTDLRRLIM